MRELILYGIFFFLLACQSGKEGRQTGQRDSEMTAVNSMQYAEKFTITSHEGYKMLEVHSPWQNSEEISMRYLLGNDPESAPDSLSELPFIITPVKRAVLLSTTYVAYLDTLGQLNTVKGISGCNYVYQADLRTLIEGNEIREVGYDNNLNFEVLIELQPDLVFMYGIQSDIMKDVRKLEAAGIHVVLCADYLEPHPLGRAEWVKFFGSFYESLDMAAEIFQGVEQAYVSLRDSVGALSAFPTVMLGLPWKDTWYIAGGNSFAARLVEDAGGNYIYAHLDHSEAQATSIESVFMQSLEADFWINPGVATSLEMILQHDRRFEELKSFKTEHIYTNGKRMSPGGGNDYWESGVMHPHVVLRDLVQILHSPDSIEKELHYYYPLH